MSSPCGPLLATRLHRQVPVLTTDPAYHDVFLVSKCGLVPPPWTPAPKSEVPKQQCQPRVPAASHHLSQPLHVSPEVLSPTVCGLGSCLLLSHMSLVLCFSHLPKCVCACMDMCAVHTCAYTHAWIHMHCARAGTRVHVHHTYVPSVHILHMRCAYMHTRMCARFMYTWT